ncbi:lipoxygenase family protein [Streptomyces alboflavus]|uniref:lipoxygenase family protein n=1 Tax=Streptomyces alboflavus TaxID=67267 RepID=UPI00368A7438
MEIDRRTLLRLTAGAAGTAAVLPGGAAAALGRRADDPLMTVSAEPGLAWQLQELPVVERLRLNALSVVRRGKLTFSHVPEPLTPLSAAKVAKWRLEGEWDKIMHFFIPDMGPLLGDTVNSIEHYRSLFQTPGVDLPWVADSFEQDTTFAEHFVAGPDPTRLVQLTSVPGKFPLTTEHLHSVPALGGDDLATAMRAGRVYWVDLALTEGLLNGRQYGTTPKYMYSPMLALCVPVAGGAPLPFAIQCGQDPAGRRIYTPRDGYSWMLARNCLLVAHMTVYETLTHLGQTHLVMGALIDAAVRTLPATHVVARLLRRHFEGTPFINGLVPQSLTNSGGLVDRVTGASMESLLPWLDRRLGEYSFSGNYLPARLAAVGSADTKALPYYPFRDDGLLLWQALNRWAGEFVGAFYTSDAAVAADKPLQAFSAAVKLTDFGRTPGAITDRQDLTDVLTMIVWTAGPLHAAVNFSQLDWMYLPAAPLAGYTPEPTGLGHTRQDWLDNLPAADVGLQHIGVGHMLTGARTSTLGDYGTEFDSTRAAAGAARLRADLAATEQEIEARNAKRQQPYPYLAPSKVPNSVEI